MKEVKFPEQREEIQKLMARSGLSAGEFADRVFLDEKSFGKYARGNMKAGAARLQQMRRVAEQAAKEPRVNESQPRFAPSSKPAVKNPPMVSDVNYESAGEERDYLADVLREISQECDVAQLEKMLLRVARSKALKSPAREEAMERLSAEIRAKSKT